MSALKMKLILSSENYEIESLVTSNKKDDLYSNWKSTCTKKDPVGDRIILKHIITDEKNKYHDKSS